MIFVLIIIVDVSSGGTIDQSIPVFMYAVHVQFETLETKFF